MTKIFLVLAFVVILFYGNTLRNGFVYDDVPFVEKNELIRDLHNLPQIIFDCVKVSEGSTCRDGGLYYRPLLLLQLMLTYQISPAPWFFHFVNLIWLLIDSWLVFQLFRVVFGRPKWALLGALLFLIHPLNSEVANFVSVNDHVLLSFFILTFLSFHRFIESKQYKYLVTTLVFYFLALLAKESALLLFIPILLYELGGTRPKLLQLIALPKLIILLSLPVIAYTLLRLAIFGQVFLPQPGYHDMTAKTQVITSLTLYPRYLAKLVYPLHLNAQHDPPVITTIDYRLWLALSFWLLNGLFIYWSFKQKYRLTIFGFSLIFLPLLPILLLVNKIGRFILAERYLLLPTVGLAFIIVDWVRRLRLPKLAIQIGFICLFLVSWYLVFQRNLDWHDEFSFDKSIAKYTNSNYGVHYNLGVLLAERGDEEGAAQSFQKALAINPNFWQAHYNLGNAYTRLGQGSLAQPEYLKAASDPTTDFFLNISRDSRDSKTTIDQYLSSHPSSGQVLQEGLAQIPSTDLAYVRVIKSGDKSNLEFFLFKANSVTRILVGPSDSPQMKVFDSIIRTMQF